jgi:hypothetical protein
MIFADLGMRGLFRVSSALTILGLLVEIASLLWFHPLAFVLFVFVGASLIGLGILVYLVSIVYLAKPTAPTDGQTKL